MHANTSSYPKGSFSYDEVSTMKDNDLGFVEDSHVDDGVPSEGHWVKVRADGEVVADRMYAVRQPILGPRKQFSIGGHRVDRLQGCSLIWFMTTRL